MFALCHGLEQQVSGMILLQRHQNVLRKARCVVCRCYRFVIVHFTFLVKPYLPCSANCFLLRRLMK